LTPGLHQPKLRAVQPETRYAKSGGVHIAYQVVGEGALDVVLVSGWVSHVECAWEEPSLARFLRRLASFCRLVLFDKRGTGLSDRVSELALPTLEQRMDDVRAVLDAVGSQRTALFGVSEGGSMSALLAATYPERVCALVMYGAFAKFAGDSEYPWSPTREEHEKAIDVYERKWGQGVGLSVLAPSVAQDERWRRWWATFERQSASPGAAVALYRMNIEIDIRHVLPAIHVPTLILHRTGDRLMQVDGSRYMAERIPGAKYVELPGVDHIPWVGDVDALVGEIEQFLTGVRQGPEPDRVLATVMFTDIVGSTERAAALGDAGWRDLLAAHHEMVRRELERCRGREIGTTGDGFLAIFDGPARAVRCACAIAQAVRRLGINIRAGLHTGEIELVAENVAGIAVHTAARVAALAGPGEVLVSSTVKDLVAGSGLRFAGRGTHALKGVPDEWRLFAVER